MSKRKWYTRALYSVFALALVVGLTLVPAVAADTPADTDVGFELGEGGSDTAEWAKIATAPGTVVSTLPVGGLGSYSVKLANAASPQGDTYVEFTPVAGTTLSDLEDLTNDWGFWYHLAEVVGNSNYGPYFELKFTSGDDFVDITIMMQGTDRTFIKWTEVELATSTKGVQYWGSVDSTEVSYSGCTTFALALSDLETEIEKIETGLWSAVADWELTRVQAQLYEIDDQPYHCYIDDITIDGTTYELEPIFLDKEYYSVGDTVEVTVPNFKANTDSVRVNPVAAEIQDPLVKDNWTVSVTSTSDSGGIIVALEETSADTGVFIASFGTADTPPVAEDELYVEDGDTITVTYTPSDPWWGAGTTSIYPVITADVDDTAPTIDDLTPADDDMTEETTPEISATYEDDTAGIDETSVEMFVDGVDVTNDASSLTDSAVAYTPEDDLAEGSHDVTVNVSDNAGNEATKSWSFRIVSWLETDSVACDSELDALDTVGVAVSITGDDANITVGRYASNPEPDAALTFAMIEDGFFDVKVTACSGEELLATQVVIKFADANITAESTAYVWDDLQGMWLACDDQGYNPTDEFLWVKVRVADTTPNISELGGTPFAISGEAAAFDPWIYDVNDDDVIQKTEALAAVVDYFALEISKAEALEVIALYFG